MHKFNTASNNILFLLLTGNITENKDVAHCSVKAMEFNKHAGTLILLHCVPIDITDSVSIKFIKMQ